MKGALIFYIIIFWVADLQAQIMQVIPDYGRVPVTVSLVAGTKTLSYSWQTPTGRPWPVLYSKDATTVLATGISMTYSNYTLDTCYIEQPNPFHVNYFAEQTYYNIRNTLDLSRWRHMRYFSTSNHNISSIIIPKSSLLYSFRLGEPSGNSITNNIDLRFAKLLSYLSIRTGSMSLGHTNLYLPDTLYQPIQFLVSYVKEDTFKLSKYTLKSGVEFALRTNNTTGSVYIEPPKYAEGNLGSFNIYAPRLSNDLDLRNLTPYFTHMSISSGATFPTKKILFKGDATNNNSISVFTLNNCRFSDTIDLRAFKNVPLQVDLGGNNFEWIKFPSSVTRFDALSISGNTVIDSLNMTSLGANILRGSLSFSGCTNLSRIKFPSSNVAGISINTTSTRIDTLDISGLTGLGSSTYSTSNGFTCTSSSYLKKVKFPTTSNYVSLSVQSSSVLDTLDISQLSNITSIAFQNNSSFKRVIYGSNWLDYTTSLTLYSIGNYWADDTLDLSKMNWYSQAVAQTIAIGNNTQIKRIKFPLVRGTTLNSLTIDGLSILDTLDLSNVGSNKLSGTLTFNTLSSCVAYKFPASTSEIKYFNINGGNPDTVDITSLTNIGGSSSSYFQIKPTTAGSIIKIIFPSNNTSVYSFTISANIINTGCDTLDLTGMHYYGSQLYFTNNDNLKKVKWPNPWNVANISYLDFSSCGGIDTLDLLDFGTKLGNTYVAETRFTVQGSTNLKVVKLPTANGAFQYYDFYNCSLDYVNFTTLSQMWARNSVQLTIRDNGMTAAEVNHILVDANSMATSGYTGRVINIGGTNADPDNSSGGYDGLAAAASLISKGFTVTY